MTATSDSDKSGSIWRRAILPALVFILVCQAAGIIGALSSPTGNSPWFQQLIKPSFNPPGWIFGPVWTLLYTLMGIAAFRVWRLGWREQAVKVALYWFALQLLLNAIWTPIFFGAQSLALGAVVIVTLLAVLGFTINRFFRLDSLAGWLLVPYFLWVSFATVLNISIWQLNT